MLTVYSKNTIQNTYVLQKNDIEHFYIKTIQKGLTMYKHLKSATLLICALCVLSLSACDSGKAIAVVDANTILSTGPHAQAAEEEINKAQAIYQYNLNVIIKKLETYKNKKQATAYLNSATQQLQAQLNASRAATTQALANALNTAITEIKDDYELILLKNNVLHASESLDISTLIQEKYDKETITYPPLPKKVDEPNLPADSK